MAAGMKSWHDIADILASIDEECLHHAIEDIKPSDKPLSLRLWAVLRDIKTMQRIAGVKDPDDA